MSLLSAAQKSWALVAKAAAWLTGVIGTFLINPPLLRYDEDNGLMLHFAQFVLAVLLGLYFLSPRVRKPEVWRLTSLVALLSGVALFFGYVVLVASWSAPYDETFRVVVGEHLSELGRTYLQQHPGTTVSLLIGAAAGATETLWPKDELILRYALLCALYTSALLCLSAAAMAMVEFVQLRAPAGRRRPTV